MVVPRDELLQWKTVFRLRPEYQRGIPWSGLLISVMVHAGVFTALAVVPFFPAHEVVVTCPAEVLLEPPRLYAVDVKPASGAKEERKTEQAEQKIEVPVEEKPAPASSQSQAVAASAAGESNYWQQVRTAVANQVRYPDFARRQRREGYVLVRLSIDADGRLSSVVPLESSSRIFVESAAQAVEKAAPFPPPPAGVSEELTAVIPICFRMDANKERDEEKDEELQYRIEACQDRDMDTNGIAGRLLVRGGG